MNRMNPTEASEQIQLGLDEIGIRVTRGELIQEKRLILPAGIMALVLLWSAVSNAAEVAICQLVAKPANFDHENVTLQGGVAGLKETTSRAGNDYATFKLQDQGGSCAVSVFTWGHPALTNNDHVRVEGVFEIEHHQGRYTFYNEVQATKVIPVPR